MNVRELIAKLEQFDGECLVLVDGYEGDFSTPKVIQTIKVDGPREGYEPMFGAYGPGDEHDAVLIQRDEA